MLEARNAGKAIGDARGEMAMVVDTFRYYAGAPERLLGDTIPVAGGQAFTVREPVGVVGLITPWNFPLTIASWKLAPGARGGQHGRAEARRADAADRAALRRARAPRPGCPTGVVNVVVGPGRTVRAAARRAPGRRQDRVHRLDRGRALDRRRRGADDQARDARARRQVGQHRLRRRRPRGGRRGGAAGGVRQRRPGLLRALADPRAGARRWSASWSCSRAPCKALRVGDPLDEETQMGPLISAEQRDDASPRSSTTARPVAFRGSAPEGPGFWFAPTVLAPGRRPARASRARRSSVRSPAVIPFADEAEAIALANDTIYGPVGLDLDARRRPRAAGRARGARPACCRSTPTAPCA